MDVREKLVELQLQADIADNISENGTQHREFIADLMIANGVTVKENMEISDELLKQLKNAPITICKEEPLIETVQEWIPVTERLPDWRDGKVLVFTKYGFSICERTVNNRWRGQHANWITHWTYLPQPPKGE